MNLKMCRCDVSITLILACPQSINHPDEACAYDGRNWSPHFYHFSTAVGHVSVAYLGISPNLVVSDFIPAPSHTEPA